MSEKKIYLVEWRDEVRRYTRVEAESEKHVKEMWKNGEIEEKEIYESGCELLDELEITEEL